MRPKLIHTALLAALLAAFLSAAHVRAGGQAPAPDDPGAAAVHEMLTRYCVGCHNPRVGAGDLLLDGLLERLTPTAIAEDRAVWEAAVRKLRAGLMPPQGMPRPDEASYARVTGWLEETLDRHAAAHPDPGRPALRRLNRTEYANAVRDLLDLEIPAASLLPPDDSAYGFDTVSDVLGLSPALQERYLAAAEKIAGLAVGEPAMPVTETYRVRQDVSQDRHIEGLPLGTVGGLQARHVFPQDGIYAFDVTLYRTNFDNVRGIEHAREVEISLDGVRVHAATIGGPADLAAAFERPAETADAIDARLSVRLPVTAGPHTVAVAFVEHLPVVNAQRLRPFLRTAHDTLDWTGRPHIQALAITGPFDASGAGDTPSRRRIFSCHPRQGDAPAACAREILSRLARRAYRRPVDEDDLRPLLELFEAQQRGGTFEEGIQSALQLILASPHFLFRVERDPPGTAPGTPYRLSDLEIASRLSFFLWSSIPDEALLADAEAGRLGDPAVLERQVRRMLADPRSRALVDNFAGQWLQLRNLRNVQPNSDLFPDFDDNLRQAFRRETELLFETIMREDRRVLDLLDADYTFVNGRLARHYGIPDVYGSRFRRVPVASEHRRGLLGHGSILALTSHAERTSPVLRGKWILENLMGTPPPPPPGDVDTSLAPAEPGEAPKTVREQMEAHRANATCASCHRIMDPLGLALENFDAVGAWRTREAGQPIDASGVLADGTTIDGVIELREALASRPELFVQTMTEKMLIYALGRGIRPEDMPAVRAIVRAARDEGYRFSAIVLGIVRSVPFQMRSS